MTTGEFSTQASQSSFEEVASLISKLVEPHLVGALDEFGEIEFPGWDGNVKKLDLEPEAAAQAGLGDSVRARIIGDYEAGIAVIMRSPSLFDTRRYGFYLQPQHNPDGPRSLEVWQAPAQKPKRGVLYFGVGLLDTEQARPSSPEVSTSLIQSLQKAAR
jgi:hypothetical protein